MTKKPTKLNIEKSTKDKKPAAGGTAVAGVASHPLGLVRDDLRRLSERFDRLFSDFPAWSPFSGRWLDFEPFKNLGSAFGAGGAEPRVDVAETDASYEVSVELPGIEEKDLNVTVADGTLTVKGEKKSHREEKKKDYHLSERTFGAFQRSFRLPDNVKDDKISAEFAKGVLTLTLPKSAAAKSAKRSIPIAAK